MITVICPRHYLARAVICPPHYLARVNHIVSFVVLRSAVCVVICEATLSFVDGDHSFDENLIAYDDCRSSCNLI